MFVIAATSLVPLAGIIGLGTEELARRAGPAVGGFLNATFGNAAELIIAVVAPHGEHWLDPPFCASIPAVRR